MLKFTAIGVGVLVGTLCALLGNTMEVRIATAHLIDLETYSSGNATLIKMGGAALVGLAVGRAFYDRRILFGLPFLVAAYFVLLWLAAKSGALLFGVENELMSLLGSAVSVAVLLGFSLSFGVWWYGRFLSPRVPSSAAEGSR